MMRYLFFLLFMGGVMLSAAAQSTRVRGMVTDEETGEPVPFATVAFPNTPVGITTDFDGVFFLESRAEVREIGVVAAGYLTQIKKVTPGSFQHIDFRLKSSDVKLEQIVVTSDDRYERAIIRRVIAAKDRNDPMQIPQLQCSIYTKTELDISNVDKTLKNKKLQKNFGFVLDYVDTSAVTGQTFLPMMISETSSRYFQRSNPLFTREIIDANRISGVEDNGSVAQFTGNLYADINLYDNFIDMFDVHFASPLSAHGDLFYKYYLVDSLDIEGRKTYVMRFHPKSFSTPVFDGELQIDAEDYALRAAHIKMMKGLNVNWVRALTIDSENTLVDGRYWYKKQEKLFADFSVVMRDSSKTVSFLGHRQVDYMHVDLDSPFPDEVERSGQRILIADTGEKRDETYWQTVRPYELSQREQNIYRMVDSIKQVPLYHDIYTIVSTLLGGYYELDKVAIGPYYKLLSYNRLEGLRVQFGGRTTSAWNRHLRLSAYAAYGTKDRDWKYSGLAEFMLKKQPIRKIEAGIKHDAVQLGLSDDALTEGNFVSSIMSRGHMTRLSIVNRADLGYRHEWRHGLDGAYGFRWQEVTSSPYVQLLRPDSTAVDRICSATFSLEHRFSWDEIVTYSSFNKFYQYTAYPVITLRIMAGSRGVLGSDYDYVQTESALMYQFKIPPLGTSHVHVDAGKIFGKVPYPLLKLHEGNGTYFYDAMAFSCMNYYEFASDAWVSLLWEHDFKGFFLGKFPLLKRLKWREAVSFKGVWGSLEDRNDGSKASTDAVLLFPAGLSSVEKPYLEAGIGVKNILRIFRVDAFWRLSHLEQTGADKIQKFTVNVGAELTF